MTDEEALRAACASGPDALAALERLLARLAAAEMVCAMVQTSLSPRLRKAAPKKLHWLDVGVALKEWEARRGG